MHHDLKEKLAHTAVICIGDVMLDHFVYGDVHRISPESPIPVLSSKRQLTILGGAGNVARNVTSLGATCQLMTVVGDDAGADRLAQLIGMEPQLNAHIFKDASRMTTEKTRFIASNQQMLRVDNEVTHNITDTLQSEIIAAYCAQIEGAQPNGTQTRHAQVTILSDYAKGVFNTDLAQRVIKIANAHNHVIIVDPKGKDYSKYKGATLLTPNKKELTDAVKHSLNSHADIIQAARDLCQQHDIGAMLVTQSADGMTLITAESDYHIAAIAHEIFDVSGAGDTVIATFASCIAAGFSFEESASIANVAAGIVVGKVGTATVSIDELSAAYRTHLGHDEASLTQYKVMTRTLAADRVKTWKDKGLSVGFTNGCFDLLHLGHLHILNQSANVCDRLIVAVNSDASVKRLKGDSRPVQDESTRAQILAALECVDGVVIFDEETPLELITLLQPDVLIKGADYTVDTVVGASIVQSRGGKVELVGLVPGKSTTSTIQRMQN